MSKLGGYSILLGLSSWASSCLFAIGPLVITCTRYPHGRVPEMYILVSSPRVLVWLEESGMDSFASARHILSTIIGIPVWIAHVGYVEYFIDCGFCLWWSRDNSLAGPVHSTDRDWLTTHSGKTLLAFNQTRVPGLESGTNWTDSKRPLRSYWIELQYNFESTQRVRRG